MMNKELLIEILAAWLKMEPEEVRAFVLMHRCKPLPISELLEKIDE